MNQDVQAGKDRSDKETRFNVEQDESVSDLPPNFRHVKVFIEWRTRVMQEN